MSLSPGLDYLARILGALLYIGGGSLAFVLLVPGLPSAIYILVFFALLFSSSFVFNRDRMARLRGLSLDEHVETLEKKGRIEREAINSQRALYFEDLSTSCAVYVIECRGGRLLCLNGQYLYEWGPISDDPEINQPRAFPTTDFDVVRRLPRREVLDLSLRGKVYEPEVLDVSTARLAKLDFRLDDGAYIAGMSFDAVRSALA